MNVYDHVSKQPTEETANRFANFIDDTEVQQSAASMIKTKKQTPSEIKSAKY